MTRLLDDIMIDDNKDETKEDDRYLQPWADSAQGEFSAHLQLLGFIFAGGMIFLATIGREFIFDIVNKWIITFIFILLLFNSILIIYAIQNHRATLWLHRERKSDYLKSNHDNNLRVVIIRITEIIFISIIVLLINILFWNLKPS